MRKRSIRSIALLMMAVTFPAGAIFGMRAWAEAPASTADDSGAEAVFKNNSLTKVGVLLISGLEAEVHTDANMVRGLKSKVVSEALARSSLARTLETAEKAMIATNARLNMIDAQQKQVKDNVEKYNQLVEPYNNTLKELKARVAARDELRKKQGHIADSQNDYHDAVVEAAGKADAATAAYAKLAADSQLAAAIAQYNKASGQTLKLGPSGSFISDAAFLKKCITEMSADGIPVRMEGGVPVVEVIVNDKRHDMIWDSGATYVSLSAETAAELGLHVTDSDRTVSTFIADGSEKKSKLVIAPLIRVGPFEATDVACIVAPPNLVRPPDLLGGSFQSHFFCRLDQSAGILHLTPIDKAASAAAPGAEPPVRAAPPKTTTVLKVPQAPQAASYQLWSIRFSDSTMKVWLKADGTAISQLGAHGTWQKKSDQLTITWKNNKDSLVTSTDGRSASGKNAHDEDLAATYLGTDRDGADAPPK